MRFATCLFEGTTRWGVLDGERLLLAPQRDDQPDSLADVVEGGLAAALETGARLVDESREAVEQDAVDWLAPLPHPRRNIFCLGLNYSAHAAESLRAKGREPQLPEHPVVFTKATGTVSGPDADIVLDPRVTEQADWEVELAVVLGAPLRHATPQQARDAIFGYSVVNDLSARDLQFRHKQFFLGKSVDDFCPMGPVIVSADEIPDPQALTLTCHVNGKLMQEGHTADQIFPVVETLVRLSGILTLEAGDIIATGTPEGVGFARRPPVYLQVGDVVECAIPEIGTLRNRMVPPPAS